MSSQRHTRVRQCCSSSPTTGSPARLFVLAIAAILICYGSKSVGTADAAPASFVITDTPAVSASSAPASDLKFVKQWQVSGDAGGEITAISALVLDLPGQVFISYGKKPSSASLLGDIKVYASSEAFANTVSIATKRAMKGSKLVVSSSNSSSSSGGEDFMLTEVVLFKKTALKKLIVNGAADVVVTNNIFFTKTKEDYPSLPVATKRALRASNSAAVSIQELPTPSRNRSSNSVPSSPNRSTWAIATTSGSVHDPIVLDLQVLGEFLTVHLRRIDSDLLPEGAIGTFVATTGEVQVNGTQAGDARDTLHIDSFNESAFAMIYLSPVVEVKSITRNSSTAIGYFDMNDLNTTFPDDALVVLANGTGNVFVSANDSAVYVADAEFQVTGSGLMQVWLKEIVAPAGVQASNHDFNSMIGSGSHVTAFFIGDPKLCITSVEYGTSTGTIEGLGDPFTPCPLYTVPKKSGRTSLPPGVQATSSSAGAGLALWSTGVALAAVVVAVL